MCIVSLEIDKFAYSSIPTSSLHPEHRLQAGVHLLAPWAPGPCPAVTLLPQSLSEPCLPLACCRPVGRLQGPPVLRPNVAAPTAELTKDRRSVGGLAVVVWSLSLTTPGRRPWTLTEMS